jgi:hypothetical protein
LFHLILNNWTINDAFHMQCKPPDPQQEQIFC